MRELILDASVVLSWFAPADERRREQARALRAEYEAGLLKVVAPRVLGAELIDAAGRGLGWSESDLTRLAAAIDALGFEFREPDLTAVAAWVGRGLTARDAAYAALASTADLRLVTDDDRLLRVAGSVAIPLADA